MKHITSIATAATVVFAAQPVISQTQDNDFGAPYSIIADHPQCSGSDAFAINMSFDAKMVHVGQGEDQCFIIERRNSERIKRPVACSDATLAARDSIDVAPQISARLRGQLAVCVSPTGQELLDSNVFVDLNVNDQQTTIRLPVANADMQTAESGIYKRVAHADVSFDLGAFDESPKLTVRVNCVHTKTEGLRTTEAQLNTVFEPEPEFLSGAMNFFPYQSGTPQPDLPDGYIVQGGTISQWSNCEATPKS